ncbi:MAG: hypothetical protein CL685_02950 [Candidatus Magasanikbacteria bacterium]|nr:hypothetical protein [Candidatus Magasanikbacteria bacterium]
MSIILLLIRKIVFIILSFILYLFVLYLFPYPFSLINVFFAIATMHLFLNESFAVVWYILLVHFFVELYSTQPFGVIVFSAVISVLIMLWLYQHVFTNKSWYTAAGLVFCTLLIFRILYLVALFILSLFGYATMFSFSSIYYSFAWEICLTTVCSIVSHLILTKSFAELQRDRVRYI